jgi:hypothetical protein
LSSLTTALDDVTASAFACRLALVEWLIAVPHAAVVLRSGAARQGRPCPLRSADYADASMNAEAVQPNKLRLHLEQRDGTLRTFAQVGFTANDASLYLVPYAKQGQYFYGEQRLPAGKTDFEVRFREQVEASARPKLSIHERGHVHIYANDSPKAGPISVRHVTEYRGEHIASVQCDHVSLLPVYTRRPKITREVADVAVGLPNDVDAGVLCVYANGERNLFQTEQLHFARHTCCADGREVWYGFGFYARDALGSGDEGGVTVLAGFDARKAATEDQDFLFLRGL